MIIAIHQPNYLPYLGFFDKMKKADVFVIYDDAQFNKEDFQHRNMIRIYHGWKWLTVPVDRQHIPIKDIRIKNELLYKGVNWKESHLRDIKDNYKNAPFFDSYIKELEVIYDNKYNKLVDLNMDIIYFLKNAFGIDTKIVFSSELGLKSRSTEKLVEVVELLDGETYLSGPAGRDYLDIDLFKNKGIKVEFQDFTHPIYKQCYEGFMPNMTALDALLNAGRLPEGGM